MKIPYTIVNSFAVIDMYDRQVKGGNGAAVIFMNDKEQFDDNTQLEIASNFPELTEAVFVYPRDGTDADFGMRYWSPQRKCEYHITGHPTIAAMHSMVKKKHSNIIAGKDEYKLETKAGNVTLRIDFSGLKIYMGQIQPEFKDVTQDAEKEFLEIFEQTLD